MDLSTGIKLIVGLGNPGQQYENTRHNVGFDFVGFLAKKYQGNFKAETKFDGLFCSISVQEHKCGLLLPTTFMNLSGQAVQKVIKFYKIPVAAVLVVHDELDFLPGVVRLKSSGGANGHNGVQNIIDCLSCNNFWRMRVGIGKPRLKEDVSDYVLCHPSKAEATQIDNAMKRAFTIIPQLILGEFEPAMSQLHEI